MRMHVKLFVFLSIFSFSVNANGKQVTREDKSYQERYTIFVQSKSESCFFLENLEVNYILNLHYMVISSKNGAQLDISTRLRDPEDKLVTFQARKKEGHYTDYLITKRGTYELCFNNKYSLFEPKKLMWELDVEGDEDRDGSQESLESVINATMSEYLENAEIVLKTIKKVRISLSRARHTSWWVGTRSTKDIERLVTIASMIDRWSMCYMVLLVLVGIIQVTMLRRLFKEKPRTNRQNFRT